MPSQQFVNEINSVKNYFPKNLWLATTSTGTNSRPRFKEVNVILSYIIRNRGSVYIKKKKSIVFVLISHVQNTDNLSTPGGNAQDGDGSDTRFKQEAIHEIGNIY